jgi:hypothetical protein
MIKTFTQTDLIRYLYQETTEEEKTEIDNALICDNELMAVFKELSTMVQELRGSELEPSAATVQNILAYSRSTNAKK